ASGARARPRQAGAAWGGGRSARLNTEPGPRRRENTNRHEDRVGQESLRCALVSSRSARAALSRGRSARLNTGTGTTKTRKHELTRRSSCTKKFFVRLRHFALPAIPSTGGGIRTPARGTGTPAG